MTTQECAKHLNVVAGDRLFDDRMIRQRVEDGELECVNPNREPRQRIKISWPAFIAFVRQHHPQLLEGVLRRAPNIAA